jgi:hypothetical protein
MIRNPLFHRLISAMVLFAALGAAPAFAGKPKKDLTDGGYTCVRVAVNFIECTKSGSPTYWCDDAGNCEAKARVKPGAAAAPKAGGVLDVNPGLTGKGPKEPSGAGAVAPKSKGY